MGSAQFPETRWTLISQIRRGAASDAGEEALSAVCQACWMPLYVFARKSGLDEQSAEDATQDFFTKLIEKNLLAEADQEKGKLRTFLLSSFRRSLVDLSRTSNSKKRGGEARFVFIDAEVGESRARFEIESRDMSPERAFDHLWAKTLLNKCLQQLREEYEKAGKKEVFEGFLPILNGENLVQVAQIAERLGMTEGAGRVALHRIRKRYQGIVRVEIQETLPPNSSVEEELSHLKEILNSSRRTSV